MDTLPAHSSVGGSTIGRLLGCASSLTMIAAVPDALRKEASVYADGGSALHDVVANLLADPTLTPESFVGKTISIEDGTTVTITAAHVRDCVLPILEFFNAEIADIDDFWLETRSHFPAVDDAFGTADFFGIGRKRSVLVDWKMGAGVGVTATYPDASDPAVETINPQLLFYLCGLVALFPEALADGRTLDAYIVQPRHQEPAKRITVARCITRDELDQFIAQVKAAVAEARGPAPRRQRGDWCRFAACKAICPEHTGPLLDFSKLPSPVPPQPFGRADAEAYARTLAAGIELAETVEPLIREYRTQAARSQACSTRCATPMSVICSQRSRPGPWFCTAPATAPCASRPVASSRPRSQARGSLRSSVTTTGFGSTTNSRCSIASARLHDAAERAARANQLVDHGLELVLLVERLGREIEQRPPLSSRAKRPGASEANGLRVFPEFGRVRHDVDLRRSDRREDVACFPERVYRDDAA